MARISVILVVILSISCCLESAIAGRNKYLWPFSSNSIWNLPIGQNAQYVHAGFKTPTVRGMFVDADIVIMTPKAATTPIYYSSAAWTKNSRCAPDSGNRVLLSAPLPTGFIVPSDGDNYSTSILLADNNTIVQTQPLAKCTSSGPYTSFVTFANEYLDQEGFYGAHGGSGLSALGGTIRLGELNPGAVIRHVMRMNIDANKYSYKNPCYRWPATVCDDYHMSVYNGQNPALVPGSLLALNKSVSIDSMKLQTEPAKIIATALQNYGAYVADDTYYYDIFTLSAELSPEGSVTAEFEKNYGYSMTSNSGAWADDLAKIYMSLSVVNSWNAGVYATVAASNGKLGAGGGAPLQPWAPAI